jgi:hypothetical protein
MKPVFLFPVAALCVSAMLGAQNTSHIPVVSADGPTIVALFPNASKIPSNDLDGNEALNDFEFYAERVKEPLSRLGVQFAVLYGRSFRIRLGGKTVLYSQKDDTPIYYFVTLGKQPRVEHGVLTDADLLGLTKQYFAFSAKDN